MKYSCCPESFCSNNTEFFFSPQYFTQRLKFKIDKADLRFGRYETSNLRGPSDRLTEVLQAVYLTKVKLKLVSIMSAASFQDWKSLANRDEGEDSFMEGDLLRVTGNIAGNTAGYVFKNAGKGLAKGVRGLSSTVGSGIEDASSKVGARKFGAGVNSFVSGGEWTIIIAFLRRFGGAISCLLF